MCEQGLYSQYSVHACSALFGIILCFSYLPLLHTFCFYICTTELLGKWSKYSAPLIVTRNCHIFVMSSHRKALLPEYLLAQKQAACLLTHRNDVSGEWSRYFGARIRDSLRVHMLKKAKDRWERERLWTKESKGLEEDSRAGKQDWWNWGRRVIR